MAAKLISSTYLQAGIGMTQNWDLSLIRLYWLSYASSAVILILKDTTKTKLAMLESSYCTEFEKNSSVEISKQCGDPQRTRVEFGLTYK